VPIPRRFSTLARRLSPILDLFPESASVAGGELVIGGVPATVLGARYGTPLLVYCERTLVAQARAYQDVDPDALVVYGTKAFPNVAVLRLFGGLGLGADVSTLGELEFALRAGVRGVRIFFHGNNKSDAELRAAAEAGATVVLDAPGELERAAAARVDRALVRLNPGVEAETHGSIRTAHAESKFGLDPDQALDVIARSRGLLPVAGVHIHIGSQLVRADESLAAVDRLAAFCARADAELDWRPETIDLGGGVGVRHAADDQVPTVSEFTGALVARLRERWAAPARLVFEPGRSLVGRAGVTLYTVGARKRSGGVDYVAVDGGMSDNPRPQLYSARYEALLANCPDEPPAETYRVAGKHCESGDVLIEAVRLPEPQRGDTLAVPATGGYTLAMSSNYNGVTRPAAVLVADGDARLIRRRETIDELLGFEVG